MPKNGLGWFSKHKIIVVINDKPALCSCVSKGINYF